MKKRIKSYIYIPVLACLLAGGSTFIWNFKSDVSLNDQNKVYYLDEYFNGHIEAESEAHTVDERNVVIESKPAISEDTESEFVLCLLDDYVVVYRADDFSESYMITGIGIGDLPEETREEIEAGKEILNEEELYFFLESHSS